MVFIAPLLTAVLFLVGARVTARTTEAAAARRRGTLFAVLAVVCSTVLLFADSLGGVPPREFLGINFGLLPPGRIAPTNVVTCVIGLLAIAMAPLVRHPPATFARILLLLAIATAFISTGAILGIVVFWVASAYVVWCELRSKEGTRDLARIFARFHVPSAIAMSIGGLLFAGGMQSVAVVLVLVAVAIREASLPVHGWLPPFVQRSPSGIVVAFVAPQLGVYAHLALLAGSVPHGLAHTVAAFGAATAVIAAALGVVQSDGRRALAFIVISQTGLVAFGLENESLVARLGAVATWQVLALATSGFIMIFAALEARRGRLSLDVLSGSFARTPRMAIAFLFLGFASVGLPLTFGFVAEDLLVQGSTEEFPLLGFVILVATALNGMTVMRCFFAFFSGRRTHQGERDLVPRERWVLTLIMAILIVAGAFAGKVLHLHEGEQVVAEEAALLGH